MDLRIPKVLPIDIQLSDGSANRALLQIAATPVGKHRGSLGIGIVPLALRSASPSLTFMALKLRRFRATSR